MQLHKLCQQVHFKILSLWAGAMAFVIATMGKQPPWQGRYDHTGNLLSGGKARRD
jgi:hypothetical protein